jgi:hypothetical protein
MIFFSDRVDGLGERLKAMLNAMVLAKSCGGEFCFHWSQRPQQAVQGRPIAPVEEVFSADFVEKYFVGANFCKDKETHNLFSCAEKISTGNHKSIEKNIILVTQQSLLGQARVLVEKWGHEIRYPEAFSDIQFSPPLEIARDAASAFTFDSDFAAVHLRAGDIIFGKYRYSDLFSGKVVALPLVEKIIENVIATGKKVIIFGQDYASIRYLQEKYGVISASDLVQPFGFSEIQKEVFEICLMSRCKNIFAGSSGFSNLASWIGNSNIRSPYKVFSSEESVSITLEFLKSRRLLKAIPALQISFACRAACLIADQSVPTVEPFITLMDTAIEFDPENDFYSFVKACSLYKINKPDAAETLLFSLFAAKRVNHKPIAYVLKNSLNNRTFRKKSDLHSVITSMAINGFPMAALCVAISNNAVRQTSQSQLFLEIAERECPPARQAVVHNVINAFQLHKMN